MLKGTLISFLLLFAILASPPAGATEPGAALSPLPSLSAAAEGSLPTEALQDLLNQVVARGVPGIVLALATPDGAWFSAAGVANLETGQLMTPRHAMRVGWETETFTAALIWSLIKEGRLSQDDRVSRRLRSAKVPNGADITIGMLLNHTSGLYDFTESSQYGAKMQSNPHRRWTPSEVLAIIRANPVKFLPGTGFAYSSSDDYLLGMIAESVTGKTVEKLLKKRLFEPNGMARSAVSRNGGLPAFSTPGYLWRDGQAAPTSVGNWSFSGQWTAGGGYSTAIDILAWARGLVAGTLLNPATLERARTVVLPSMTGYGFQVTQNALGYGRFGRIGVKPGSTTDLMIYPDQGRALFIGFNISDGRSAPTLPTYRMIRDLRGAIERLLGWNVEPDFAETIESGRTIVQDTMNESCASAATVGLIDNDRIVWSEAYGSISKDPDIPPGPDTLFAIGSTSKVFAGMAVMKLVDQGKIDLDAPLVRYLPDFQMNSPEYPQVTVRMLLNHSSGFPGGDYRNDTTYVARPDFAAQVQQTLATERLKYTPGLMANYCNDGFTMVQPLVESVSGGRSYPQFVEDEILAPLGMDRTWFATTPFPAGSFAPFFSCGSDVPESQIYTNPLGAGGAYSTPSDMLRLAAMLMDGGIFEGVRILSESSAAEIVRDQTMNLPVNPVPTEKYGLGLDTTTYAGLDAVGVLAFTKMGGAAGYSTQFLAAPEEGLAVVVTGIAMGFNSYLAAEKILMHALVEHGALPRLPEPMKNSIQPEKPATRAQLADMVGNYAEFYKVHKVEAGPDRTLTVTNYMGYGGAMTPVSKATGLKRRADGTFSSDLAPNVSYRALNAGGHHYLAIKEPTGMGHYRVESVIGERIDPRPPLSPAWQARVWAEWLVVNDSAASVWLARGAPRFTFYALPDVLPGYVFAVGQPMLAPSDIVDPSGSDTLARMFLQVPQEGGRDQNDVIIEVRGGEEWIRYGSLVYRPKAGVPVLPAGQSQVAIGPEGYAEWRMAPGPGKAQLVGTTSWKVYDHALTSKTWGIGDGPVQVEEGSYLMLYGAPDTTITVDFPVVD